jgi:serine/threonine-protein kinase
MEWPKLQEIFWAARALPHAQRDAFLTHACAGDEAALTQLRLMLQADATSDGPLDRTPALFTPLAQSATLNISEHVGPYIVGAELGRGGMGVVHRAYDPRLRRDVALKFLATHKHDSAARARFIDEARTASALDHPHNCPVYDIGSTADGQVYIAMALCSGGSLADRLANGPLPVSDAMYIARQIASALHAAHEAGIIHRDIKPANIAFTEHDIARVLDFGIAAFGEAAPQAAGTLAYMSPEQLHGEVVDRRTDVWALGVVLYEMLAGRKPFEAADRSGLARAIAEGSPADLRALRPEVPPAVARIVARALAKDPRERYATAGEFADALKAISPARAGRRRIISAVVAIVLVAIAGVTLWRARAGAADVDHNAVAVLPFRVSGDASLSYLQEGMAELIAAKLTGEGGLRAADPLSVLSRVGTSEAEGLTQPAALRIARQLGAGHALHGNIVGSADRIVINASLVDLRGRVTRGTAEGPHSALSQLVDRVVAELLSAQAGEEPQRLEALTSTSLPALRAYLEGQASYRRGNYAQALDHYGRALDYDSTFALAGLGLELADGWAGTGHAGERGRAVAWRWRDRLSARDRALLEVNIGTAYPRRPSATERLDATERALRLAPDRAQLWYTLGDLHFHWGRIIGGDDWEARAERGFLRALELDSAFAAPRHHLIALYARQGRKRELQQLANVLLAREPRGPTADYINWRLGVALGNGKASHQWIDSLATETLGWISMSAVDDGVAIDDARRAFRARGARPGTREERLERMLGLHADALNAGRPQLALELTDSMVPVEPDSNFHLRVRVLAALYGGGHRRAAQLAAESLRRNPGTNTRTLDRCVAAQWLDPRTASIVSPDSSIEQQVCTAVLARDAARIDQLYRAGPLDFYRGDGHVEHAPVALARLLEAQGERAAALTALRRRPYFIGWQPFLASSLRDEGRLAAAIGQRDVAIRAYRHYLALRSNPDPLLRPQADSVRAELDRLTR